MDFLYSIPVFILAFYLLARSGTILVSGLTYFSRLMGVSEYLVAFFLMSFATSLSELFVGVSSAIFSIPDLSLGNIMGANIINISLVVGFMVFFAHGVEVQSKISRSNFLLVVLLASMPLLLALDGEISRIDGLVLLLMFALYSAKLLRTKEYFTRPFNQFQFGSDSVKEIFHALTKIFAGVVLLIVSSFLLVFMSRIVVSQIGLPIFVFGTFAVAFGTTLPEIAFGIRAASLKHNDMVLGNSLGSVAFNSVVVLGVVAIISPIRLMWSPDVVIAALFMMLSLLLFNLFTSTKNFMSRREAMILISVYFLFVVISILL